MTQHILKAKLKKPAIGAVLHLSQGAVLYLSQAYSDFAPQGTTIKVLQARYDRNCGSGLRIILDPEFSPSLARLANRGLDSSWFEEYITPAVLSRREEQAKAAQRQQEMKDWYESALGRAYIAFRDSQPDPETSSFETIKKFAERVGVDNLDLAIQNIK
jgi:hypothetical protein